MSTLLLEWSDLSGPLYVIILPGCSDVSDMLKVVLLGFFQVQFVCSQTTYNLSNWLWMLGPALVLGWYLLEFIQM